MCLCAAAATTAASSLIKRGGCGWSRPASLTPSRGRLEMGGAEERGSTRLPCHKLTRTRTQTHPYTHAHSLVHTHSRRAHEAPPPQSTQEPICADRAPWGASSQKEATTMQVEHNRWRRRGGGRATWTRRKAPAALDTVRQGRKYSGSTRPNAQARHATHQKKGNRASRKPTAQPPHQVHTEGGGTHQPDRWSRRHPPLRQKRPPACQRLNPCPPASARPASAAAVRAWTPRGRRKRRP